jgi:hypothetical protein
MKIWICIGTFPTTEMATISFDTIIFHLRGDSSSSSLIFSHYISHIKIILEDLSPSKTSHNIRCVVWKDAEVLTPLTIEGCKILEYI